MPPHSNFDHSSDAFSIVLTLALVLAASLYLVGWRSLRRTSGSNIPAWLVGSFFLGLVMVWIAAASPFAAYDHYLLTVHMIKHLLLMTVAPGLILLGEAPRALWIRAPQFLRRALRSPFSRSLANFITRPAICWTVSALVLFAWHLPGLFTLAMHSATLHLVQDILFFVAGLLFWWPVIQPWPAPSRHLQWSMILYLFLATLPCDILSGFLAFSDRVVYPIYYSVPRTFGLTVLADQQFAAALMWTCVTFLYLVPAVIISTRILTPRNSNRYTPSEHEQVAVP